MAQRAQFENSCEVGVFAKMTNSYCLTALGGSHNFYSLFEAELADHIPVVQTSIAGTRIVGRVTVGNKNGLIVPSTTTDQVFEPSAQLGKLGSILYECKTMAPDLFLQRGEKNFGSRSSWEETVFVAVIACLACCIA
mmetsp:Transcript_7877/g.17349  ORF Transcript_7877/g.17349 Transcript_7877/m.17349 type:complete len:137 (-) Transcript_7877:1147-1557(-)